MIPIFAIVGRPNVGKSTLFNRLTKTRQALVANRPGLTRDRQYGYGTYREKNFIVIDTGGLTDEKTSLAAQIKQQTEMAMSEAQAIFLMVDAKDGLTPMDESLVKSLRKVQKPIFLVINKIDAIDLAEVMPDFHRLGFTAIFPIAASHGRGVDLLMQGVLPLFSTESEAIKKPIGVTAAVVGRPNVGKSTLINTILGEPRVTVLDEPGTTRDSIFIPFKRREKEYVLVDTAGVRRRQKIYDVVEKFSVVKTLQAIESADVVVFLIDATENIADQDLKLLGFILESGRALVIAVNKWDAVSEEEKKHVKSELERRLTFVEYAKWHFISAIRKQGVGDLFRSIDEAYEAAHRELSTPKLTRLLTKATEKHQPPLVRGHRVKLRYAHSGGHHPPVIVIHGARVTKLPRAYERFLENFYREELKLFGTPIRILFKESND